MGIFVQKMFRSSGMLAGIGCLLLAACGDSKVTTGTYAYSNGGQNAVLEVAAGGTFKQEIVKVSDGSKSSVTGKWRQKGAQIIFHPFLMPLDDDTGKPLDQPSEVDTVYAQVSGDTILVTPDYGYNYQLK
ncbi:MAG: hypothetical protein EOP88_24455 [Verrucomicrobiaceae bacterium]|nr:MAG: hypothetical protein EOP88_24455 [Verrucomicrobiaceae bacterium]